MPAPFPVLLLSRDLGGGGSQRQLTEVAKRLDRAWFSPHVGCFDVSGLRAAELKNAGVPVVEFPARSLRSPATLRVAARFGEYVRAHRIAIVHAFDVPAALFAVPAARWHRVPVVLSSQRASRDLTPGLFHRLLRITDRMVDAIVVNCVAVRDELIARDGVPPERLRLCYNSIDIDQFEPRRPAPAGAPLVIGSTSMLRPEKGVETLIAGFARVRAELSGDRAPTLLLVGDGPLRADLEALATRLGVREVCEFAGADAGVAAWLQRIDIFVLPSLSEALSNSLLEAMASGCAAIASRVGGNPEIARAGDGEQQTGLLFEPGDAADLARSIRTLIDDAELRMSLSAAGRRLVESQFSPRQSLGCFQDLYLEQLERKQLLTRS